MPECLKESLIVENYKDDNEAIETLLTHPVDTEQLQELKTESIVVEAPNLDYKHQVEDIVARFKSII